MVEVSEWVGLHHMQEGGDCGAGRLTELQQKPGGGFRSHSLNLVQ